MQLAQMIPAGERTRQVDPDPERLVRLVVLAAEPADDALAQPALVAGARRLLVDDAGVEGRRERAARLLLLADEPLERGAGCIKNVARHDRHERKS